MLARLTLLAVVIASCGLPAPTASLGSPSGTVSASPLPTSLARSDKPSASPAATTPTTPEPMAALPLLTYEVSDGIFEADLVPLRIGFSRASLFLSQHVGGDRQRPVIVRVRPYGGTQADIDPDGTSVIYIRIDHYARSATGFGLYVERQLVAAHEYVHTWHKDLGCLGAPKWFKEGMADYVAYETATRAGAVSDQEVLNFHSHIKRAPLQAPLADLEQTYSQAAYPYSVGYHAVRLLTSFGGTAALRTFCSAVAARLATPVTATAVRPYWRAAFLETYGISLERFYARFDEYRLGLGGASSGTSEGQLSLQFVEQLPVGSVPGPPQAIPVAFAVGGVDLGRLGPAEAERLVSAPYWGWTSTPSHQLVVFMSPATPPGQHELIIRVADGREARATFQLAAP